MKILIVSDTHGKHGNLEWIADEIEELDMVIHLGDVEGEEDYIEALFDCPVHIVGGNNDFFSKLPREEEFCVAGCRIFITHGHYYYVGVNEERLKKEARARGVDIVMYGHTHKPAFTREEDLITLNPGSISYPRQSGRRASYMIMEIGANKSVQVELEYV